MTLKEITATVPDDRRDWLAAELEAIRRFATIRLARRSSPDQRKDRADLKALLRAREIIATAGSTKDVGDALDYEIHIRKGRLRGVTWTPSEAMRDATGTILDKLATARQLHVGHLRPGRSPDGCELTQDAAIVHSLFAAWGLHEAKDTTHKRVAKIVASARPDADFEAEHPDARAERISRQEVEGTLGVPF